MHHTFITIMITRFCSIRLFSSLVLSIHGLEGPTRQRPGRSSLLLIFFSLLLSILTLSDRQVHQPRMRALLETAASFCRVIIQRVLNRGAIHSKLRRLPKPVSRISVEEDVEEAPQLRFGSWGVMGCAAIHNLTGEGSWFGGLAGEDSGFRLHWRGLWVEGGENGMDTEGCDGAASLAPCFNNHRTCMVPTCFHQV